jgi:hypothetical protein
MSQVIGFRILIIKNKLVVENERYNILDLKLSSLKIGLYWNHLYSQPNSVSIDEKHDCSYNSLQFLPKCIFIKKMWNLFYSPKK